jgi:hypothetical protein
MMKPSCIGILKNDSVKKMILSSRVMPGSSENDSAVLGSVLLLRQRFFTESFCDRIMKTRQMKPSPSAFFKK